MSDPKRPDVEDAGELRDAEALGRWLDGDRSAGPDPRDAEVVGLLEGLRGEEAVPEGAWARIAAGAPARRRQRPRFAVLALAAAALLAAGIALWAPGGAAPLPGPTLAELELAQGALMDTGASPSERLARMAQAADAGRQRIIEGLPGGS